MTTLPAWSRVRTRLTNSMSETTLPTLSFYYAYALSSLLLVALRWTFWTEHERWYCTHEHRPWWWLHLAAPSKFDSCFHQQSFAVVSLHWMYRRRELAPSCLLGRKKQYFTLKGVVAKRVKLRTSLSARDWGRRSSTPFLQMLTLSFMTGFLVSCLGTLKVTTVTSTVHP